MFKKKPPVVSIYRVVICGIFLWIFDWLRKGMSFDRLRVKVDLFLYVL